jgi:8-oxo-dGTP pyrophosphatase MutT (NUDIX family)
VNSQSSVTHQWLAGIAEQLQQVRHEGHAETGRTLAAVAMILRNVQGELEILFIERAAHEQDPWSGHIAFPGGKLETGELPCQAAQRETLEEIGIDLRQGRYLGRLSDIIGANLPVRVSCCVFALEQDFPAPQLNSEVSSLFWCSLQDLCDSERHMTAPVRFGDKCLDVPAIRLPFDGKPVLWGITYRIVIQFIELIAHGGKCGRLPETIQLYEEERI